MLCLVGGDSPTQGFRGIRNVYADPEDSAGTRQRRFDRLGPMHLSGAHGSCRSRAGGLMRDLQMASLRQHRPTDHPSPSTTGRSGHPFDWTSPRNDLNQVLAKSPAASPTSAASRSEPPDSSTS